MTRIGNTPSKEELGVPQRTFTSRVYCLTVTITITMTGIIDALSGPRCQHRFRQNKLNSPRYLVSKASLSLWSFFRDEIADTCHDYRWCLNSHSSCDSCAHSRYSVISKEKHKSICQSFQSLLRLVGLLMTDHVSLLASC